MSPKKIMLIGRSRAGKTTLIEYLVHGVPKSKKTQSIERVENYIDTPGEFMENPHFYKALLITSYDADLIIMVEEATEQNSLFPPHFSTAFNKPVIGVITKMDKKGDPEKIYENLKRAGAEAIFPLNYDEPSSFEPFIKYLENIQGGGHETESSRCGR